MGSKGKAKKSRRKAGNRGDTLTARKADRHVLYEHSVQCVEADLDFFERVFRRKRGYPFRLLREDFCGTAALAVDWVGRGPEHRAWGVDLDQPTLEWGRKHHVSRLGADADRVVLMQDDVMTARTPPVEVVAALNFSYCVFQDRATLRRYFERAHRALTADGILFLDIFGGTEAMDTLEEDRTIPAAIRPDGTRIPSFTYSWEQASFNPIDHHIRCHIHFSFADGTRLRRAFTYDWRLWTLPELQELILEAGFRNVEVYMEGWDEDEEEADGVFRRRTRVENMAGWVGYVVGLK